MNKNVEEYLKKYFSYEIYPVMLEEEEFCGTLDEEFTEWLKEQSQLDIDYYLEDEGNEEQEDN